MKKLKDDLDLALIVDPVLGNNVHCFLLVSNVVLLVRMLHSYCGSRWIKDLRVFP